MQSLLAKILPKKNKNGDQEYSRFGVGIRLIGSFGLIATLTIIISLVSWFSINQLTSAQKILVDENVPAITEALSMANATTAMTAATPALNAAKTSEEKDQSVALINETYAKAEEHLSFLKSQFPENETLSSIEQDLAAFSDNINAMAQFVGQRHKLQEYSDNISLNIAKYRVELVDQTQPYLLPIRIGYFDSVKEWEKLIEKAIEDAVNGKTKKPNTALVSALGLKHLTNQDAVLTFRATGQFMIGLIAESAVTDDIDKLADLEQSFTQNLSNMASQLSGIQEVKESPALTDLFKKLLEIGVRGDETTNIYTIKKAQTSNEAESLVIQEQNLALANQLSEKVNEFVNEVQGIADTAATQADKTASTAITALIVAAIVSLIIVALIGWLYVKRHIITRIEMLLNSMQRLSEGDLNCRIMRDGNDEFAKMGNALSVLRNVSREAEQLKEQQEAEKARNEEEKRQAALTMADNFDASVGQSITVLSGNVGKMRNQAGGMLKLADQTRQEAGDVSNASDDMNNDISSIASAIEELSASISSISSQVTQNSEVSQEAVHQAEAMNGNINRLEAASKKVEDVTELINSIAEQTNLLALNATIEAARAGDAGKGFAVVANEVKNLANQTTNATEEISQLIANIQSEIRGAANTAENFSQVIDRIENISGEINAAVEEQGSATHEINATVAQSAQNCALIASRVQEITRAIGEVSTVMEDVMDGVTQVDDESNALNNNVVEFVNNIRQS